jgi:hypothetical protein
MSATGWQKKGLGATKSSALTTSTSIVPPTRGIHCNVGGDVVGQLEEDSADGTFTLVAGSTYPYAFKSISSIGTATGRMLF